MNGGNSPSTLVIMIIDNLLHNVSTYIVISFIVAFRVLFEWYRTIFSIHVVDYQSLQWLKTFLNEVL